MSLPKFCIQRPVFTIVLSLVLIVFGLISYQRLPVRSLPKMEQPVVTINTVLAGADPAVIEDQITIPIENSLSGITGVEHITSTSRLGKSSVVIEFKVNADLNEAMSTIRNEVSSVKKRFPTGTKEPTVRRINSDAEPSIIISFADPNLNAMQITDFLNRSIQPEMQQLSGVGEIFYYGARTYAIRVFLDPAAMAAKSIMPSDVVKKLEEQNVYLPSGQIRGEERVITVTTDARFRSAKAFGNLIIKDNNGAITRLKNIAKISVGPAKLDNALRVDGKPAVGFAVIPQSLANPIDISREVKQLLPQLKAQLPSGMEVSVVYDAADYIQQSIHEVYRGLIEAVALVTLVVFLFLGTVRSAAIPVLTIPVCLIGIFGPLYWLGLSINTITLLAMVLAIGLVVDDAIVVLENIYRNIEQGLSRWDAAIKGSHEIIFAVLAMTITLAAVYAPTAFSQGITGAIFRPFAVTLAGTVILSGFVALTLSPMLCARWLPTKKNQSKYSHWLDQRFETLKQNYQGFLHWVLLHRKWVLLVLIASCIVGFLIIKDLPMRIAPAEDVGVMFGDISAPTDSSFAYTNEYAKKIEKIYAAIPEQKNYFVDVGHDGPSSAFSLIILKPWEDRTRTIQQIQSNLTNQFSQIPGVTIYTFIPSPLDDGGTSGGFSMELLSTGDYFTLQKTAAALIEKANDNKNLINLRQSLGFSSQQYTVTINKDFAAQRNVSIAAITNSIATFLGGVTATNFEYGGRDYDVIVQLNPDNLKNINSLNQIFVRNDQGKMLPLSSLVTVKTSVGATARYHYDRIRSTTITALLAPGYSMGEAVNYFEKLVQQLPANTHYQFSGGTIQFLNSHGSMNMALILSLLFIYLVLAAQFESFRDPFIVLLTVPLCIIGALFSLWIADGSLNIYTQIGLITLIGLIAKHGILITEFANQLRSQGVELKDALVQAASQRLRPILMTTAAMVLGAVPLILASGAGAHARQQIGVVIIGGLLLGTFFSLVVVPVAYSAFAKKKL